MNFHKPRQPVPSEIAPVPIEASIRHHVSASCWEWQVGPERGFTNTRWGATRRARSVLRQIAAARRPDVVSDWEQVQP